jgi:hypothetical protein
MRPLWEIQSHSCDTRRALPLVSPVCFGKLNTQLLDFSKQGAFVHPQFLCGGQSVKLIPFERFLYDLGFR